MKKVKHDHRGTKLLKLGIFASLMLAPLLAIGFKCAYVTFNKNAKDSYSQSQPTIQYKYQSNEVNAVNDLVVGNIYTFTFNSSETRSARIGIDRVVFDDDLSQYNFQTIQTGYDTTIRINYTYSNVLYPVFVISPFNTIYNVFTTSQPINFIYGNSSNNQNIEYILPMISECQNIPIESFTSNENCYLDNAFYYAIDEMKNNELFNWTTNTALYTPTAAMTNGMGITTNALPILITYWLYLTAIYIVIDIVVELFTALTHMITSRFEQ